MDYLMVHLFEPHNRDFGGLLFIRQSLDGEVRLLLDLDEFFRDIEIEEPELTFLSSSSMMALFSLESLADDVVTLHVLNLRTARVDLIRVPQLERFNLEFCPWERVSFHAIGVADFEISVVVLGLDDLVIAPMILALANGAFLVSRRWDGDEQSFAYAVTTVDALATQEFGRIAERDFDPVEEGWVLSRSYHHGRDGMAVMSQTELFPQTSISRLHEVALFSIAEDWSTYLHISTVPSLLIPRDERDYTSAPYVLQANDGVHVVYIAPSRSRRHNAVSIVHFTCRPGLEPDWEARTTTFEG
ncbi:hypothetical protein Tco_0519095 [Tanacetum coccineum]